MTINFDVLINTDQHVVDMKTGLETFQGASEAVRQVVETVLTGNVPKRQTHTKDVRTILKQSFKGSYGQIFSLDIGDKEIEKKYKSIGPSVLAELISYFLNDALYRETNKLSPNAEKMKSKLGETEEQLIEQLRKSALEHLHSVPSHFGHSVELRYRKSKTNLTTLAEFNKASSYLLKPIEEKQVVNFKANITRLNINTGNGRLLPQGEKETVAFGFKTDYKDIKAWARKKFSENLDHNNTLSSTEWVFLEIKAYPLKLKNGKIIKYLITGVE